MKCSRCGYQWESKVPNPKECPRCKSRLDYVSMPVGAPKIKFEKREVNKAMTSKLPWVAAAAIIVIATAGAWMILGSAPAVPTETGEWSEIQSIVPGQAFGLANSNSTINGIHFMKHGSSYVLSENLGAYAAGNDNRIGSILASGAEIGTFPFDTTFDIIVDVVGHDDNMGQVNKNYLKVSLAAYKSTGWNLPTENADDLKETTYSNPAGYLFVNVQWDNGGNGYTLAADDNLFLENVILWLRG